MSAIQKVKEEALPPLTPNFSIKDYVIFFGAGGSAATVTHGMVTPMDVVKTRIQIDPSLKGMGMLTAGRKIVAAEGPSGLLSGFGATAIGYLVQGGAKFAGYEFWKKQFVEMVGSQDKAVQNRTAIYLGGAAAAEFFADILLCPLEAARIRTVSNPKFASGLGASLTKIVSTEGFGSLYAGFVPLLFKQIPFACGQFAVNEFAHEVVNKQLGEEAVKNLSGLGSVGVTLGCGVTAGVAAAVLSHPADTLLSQMNRGGDLKGSMASKLIFLAKEAGPVGIWRGLGPRIAMTATLVSAQFIMYDWIKHDIFDAPPGVEIHKD